MRVIKIPEHRVGAIIGENGKTKRLIEDKCKVILNIKSDGDVEVLGEEDAVFFAEPIIIAIARGFSVKDAIKLTNHDYLFFLFDLREYTNTKNGVVRFKSRIIGREGRVKTNIESATDSIINVHGHTVGIISKYDSIDYAKKAITMILNGVKHTTIETYLSKARKEIFDNRIAHKSGLQ